MKKLLPIFLLGVSHAFAADLFYPSLGAVAGAKTADIYTSYGHYELNPLMPTHIFGKADTLFAAGITGGMLVAEVLVVKKWPRLRRPFTRLNLAIAGGVGATALHNTKE